MSDSKIRLAVLDMAGTTVLDDGLVMRAFAEATAAAGIPVEGPNADAARRYVLDTMGQSKIVVFRALTDGDEDRAQAANQAFESAYDSLIDTTGIAPVPGAADAITTLQENGIRVALTTGFSRGTQHKLLASLGWTSLADLTLAPSEDVRGRPFPDMILAALLLLQIDDVREVAVLGDTANDITSGLRAGASIVAGALTGAHDEDRLRGAGATEVVPSVCDFADLLLATR